MKLSTVVLSVFCIGYMLEGFQCQPSHEKKLWTLDQARNRELFLSVLQSYFSNRGLHVDRNAPAFSTFPAKSMQTRQTLLLSENGDLGGHNWN